jgi:hypothetical protein
MSYQTQTSAAVNYSDNEYDSNTESSLHLTHSITKIDITKGPLALSFFLNKSSNISASHYESLNDASTRSSVSGNIVLKNKYAINTSYNTSKQNGQSSDSWHLNTGYYLSDTEAATINVLTDGEISDFNLRFFGLYQANNDNYYSISGGITHVHEPTSDQYGINGGLTYYPNLRVSHRVLSSLNHSDLGSGVLSYSLSYAFNYFIQTDLSSHFNVFYADSESDNIITNSVIGSSISITKRF